MTIVINLGLHGGRISGIFITGIFTLSGGGGFLTFKTGIPGGLDPLASTQFLLLEFLMATLKFKFVTALRCTMIKFQSRTWQQSVDSVNVNDTKLRY